MKDTINQKDALEKWLEAAGDSNHLLSLLDVRCSYIYIVIPWQVTSMSIEKVAATNKVSGNSVS